MLMCKLKIWMSVWNVSAQREVLHAAVILTPLVSLFFEKESVLFIICVIVYIWKMKAKGVKRNSFEYLKSHID